MADSKTKQLVEESDAHWIDLRFSDSRGSEHHVTIAVAEFLNKEDEFFSEGRYFDGSSISGWQGIHESDMKLVPDDDTAVLDPFCDAPTVALKCYVVNPDGTDYPRDPRSVARRAEEYLRSTGIADTANFGPEPEFFVFDSVRWENRMGRAMFDVESQEAAWSAGKRLEEGNRGHRPGIKGGYFPLPPVDSLHDLRSAMCENLQAMGLKIEVHHHEVATAGQCEIGVVYDSMLKKADQVATLKYCVRQTADQWGKTATFMPKPLVGDNGSGMHVHQSLALDGKNIFFGDKYSGLSQEALYYIGGIIKHVRAINAFSNSTTNSYKRLVPGYEAPNIVVYSAKNRSAAIRIPKIPVPQATRVEVRFPDSCGNPHLCFAAMLMAGLDGIENKIDPGGPHDLDLYTASESVLGDLPKVARHLDQALGALDKDRAFLTKGGVFSDDLIDSYIELKGEEVTELYRSTHPLEFALYYSS